MTSRQLACAVLFIALCVGIAAAQQASAPPPPAPQPGASPDIPALDVYAKKQFGPECKVTPVLPRGIAAQKHTPNSGVVLLTADLDGDGAEDAVIVAQCPKPLAGEVQFGYKVADPYDTYFGYGDPRVTQTFNAHDPENDHVLLIVHGWRLPQPKGKFVIINLPFDTLSITQVALRKRKTRAAITATESGVMESTIFWNGRKYSYQPGTGEIDE